MTANLGKTIDLMRIVIIGAGNMASLWAVRLWEAGREISQVYSRTLARAASLAEKTGAVPITDIRLMDPTADVYLFALSDDAIGPVFQEAYIPPHALTVHCSGALPIESIKGKSLCQGVIWPLYSIIKEHLPPLSENIPLIMEANGAGAVERLVPLARCLSDNIKTVTGTQRAFMHLNAVWANNFTNHLLAIAERLCQEQDLPFEMLLPIIAQTTKSVASGDRLPSGSQTGPALRHDERTISRHLSLLEGHSDWQTLYSSITKSIQDYYDTSR